MRCWVWLTLAVVGAGCAGDDDAATSACIAANPAHLPECDAADPSACPLSQEALDCIAARSAIEPSPDDAVGTGSQNNNRGGYNVGG